MNPKPAYWQTKSPADMTEDEWEALCDGCGKCCLNKLEDQETGELHFTNAACRFLDLATCRCSCYPERTDRVKDCIEIGRNFRHFEWLPGTCAYRLLAEGKELPPWHPLVTGDPRSVFAAGVSVRTYAVSEAEVDDITAHVIERLP